MHIWIAYLYCISLVQCISLLHIFLARPPTRPPRPPPRPGKGKGRGKGKGKDWGRGWGKGRGKGFFSFRKRL